MNRQPGGGNGNQAGHRRQPPQIPVKAVQKMQVEVDFDGENHGKRFDLLAGANGQLH